jgi:hypothetical protein
MLLANQTCQQVSVDDIPCSFDTLGKSCSLTCCFTLPLVIEDKGYYHTAFGCFCGLYIATILWFLEDIDTDTHNHVAEGGILA